MDDFKIMQEAAKRLMDSQMSSWKLAEQEIENATEKDKEENREEFNKIMDLNKRAKEALKSMDINSLNKILEDCHKHIKK